MRNSKILFVLFLILIFCFDGSGQISRKPTPTTADSSNRALSEIKSQPEFDSVARTFHPNTPYALPHAMFVIDRRDKNKIYYVNSQKYRFHKDFLLSNYLVARGDDLYTPIYIDQNRRFVVGTIAWQKSVEKFTWELNESDLANSELIKLAHDVINRTFFEKVYYKPNSTRQEDASARLGDERVTQNDINKNQEYLALNTGSAIGRVHIIEKLDDTVEIGSNEIVILKELPLTLPPVAGIIVAKPSTPLSHVNILAKGWGIPNVYIKDADKLFKELNTKWIKFDASLTKYDYKFADKEILDQYKPPDIQVPPVNFSVKTLTPLRQMRKKDSVAFGSKSANLGEMLNAKIPNIIVPDGFSVPFYWDDKFMKDNGFDKIVEEFEFDIEFVHNPRVRRKKLEEFRKQIQGGKFDENLRKQILQRWKTQLGGKPVFVRSSSNSEDLPDFSGAGLYSSKANVKEADKLIEAVKYVWASLWNFDAYDARVRNYVSQTDVYMSALIQVGVNMQKGGVMVTKDLFDEDNKNAVFISAVCGHNSTVVNNNGIPEQILFNPKSNSVVVKTLSDQKNAFVFAESGDLKETPDKCAATQSKRVLSDAEARLLAKTALNIKRVFGGKKEQDIEWGIMNGLIYIVQSRPYIEKR